MCRFPCAVDGSVNELSVGAGGKKNRQKERRLMKGFNIALQPSGASLQPVAETTTPGTTQHSLEEPYHESPNSKKRHHHPHHQSTNSVPGLGSSSSQRHARDSRDGSRKRKWGTLIEAAKAGRVSRLIGKLYTYFIFTSFRS